MSGRTRGVEVPLYQAEDQRYLYYSKGALVMMAMHDLIEELRRVTPVQHHEIIDRWWKGTAVFDSGLQEAETQVKAAIR